MNGIPASRSRRNLWLALLLGFTLGIAALVFWFGTAHLAREDRLFRGRPESQWIKNLKYLDDQQVVEWRGYGEEGVQVLIRGLEKADHPGQRAYRQFSGSLPAFFRRWMPAPKSDSTQGTRHCVVSLLASLGNAATNATPVMIWTVRKDENDSVRQSALCYFNSSEDDNCLLNKLPAPLKVALLPALLRDVQNGANWGLRNNAALALRYYPEQREVVAPVLLRALRDPEPHVRLLAAEALNRVDPEAARKAGTTQVIVAITKNPDDQIASKAVSALRRPGTEPDLALPALVESLKSTNTLIACEAVWALEWAGKDYDPYADRIVAALSSAAQRKDNACGYAKKALARWRKKTDLEPLINADKP